jgi:molybdopterin converting factor small subunit
VTAGGVRPGVEATMTTIRIPGPLRSIAGGESDVAVEAATVGGALTALVRRHPGLHRHLRTEGGALREHVNVYLNEDDIRTLDGEDTALDEGDTLTVVPSIAGG